MSRGFFSFVSVCLCWVGARSVFWWESDSSNDGAIALVGVEEVVGGVVLDPEQNGRMLAIGCFKERESLFLLAELRVFPSEFDGRDVSL